MNVYGDSFRAAEYPSSNVSSIFDNGSIKTKELTDEEIVNAIKNPGKKDEVSVSKNLNKINSTETKSDNIKISAKGKMTFSYGNNKRNDVKSTTTLEAIKNGERTATTRYESNGHIGYWKNLKIG